MLSNIVRRFPRRPRLSAASRFAGLIGLVDRIRAVRSGESSDRRGAALGGSAVRTDPFDLSVKFRRSQLFDQDAEDPD